MQCRSRAGPSLFSKKTASLRYQFYVQPGRYRACTVCLTFGSMDPATALPPAPPQRKATSSAESESSSAHEEDDLSLASDWTNEDERASQGDGQPRVNDKSPTIDNDVQDSLLVVSTSATDVETLRGVEPRALPLRQAATGAAIEAQTAPTTTTAAAGDHAPAATKAAPPAPARRRAS